MVLYQNSTNGSQLDQLLGVGMDLPREERYVEDELHASSYHFVANCEDMTYA